MHGSLAREVEMVFLYGTGKFRKIAGSKGVRENQSVLPCMVSRYRDKRRAEDSKGHARKLLSA
jgi:hypothetical protein